MNMHKDFVLIDPGGSEVKKREKPGVSPEFPVWVAWGLGGWMM